MEYARGLSAAFEHVADVIRPSVVRVRSIRKVNPDALPEGHPNFFDESRPDGGIERGLGSGVIVSEDGFILTNHHVVAEADEVRVTLDDDRSFTAEVIGVDPKTDLAVIRIDAERLSAARLGDSDRLRIGEWVVAAGNPYGLSSSITAGIVSGKGRRNVGIADYEDFIQTDAAIHPGNSGGPLVNLEGQVVGINTAIFSRNGSGTGIGFAIPVNMARGIQERLIREGRVARGYLGVMIRDVASDSAGRRGVLVTSVRAGTPAARSGIAEGDVIVRVGDTVVRETEELRAAVAALRPGTAIDVEVIRDGTSVTVPVTLAELP